MSLIQVLLSTFPYHRSRNDHPLRIKHNFPPIDVSKTNQFERRKEYVLRNKKYIYVFPDCNTLMPTKKPFRDETGRMHTHFLSHMRKRTVYQAYAPIQNRTTGCNLSRRKAAIYESQHVQLENFAI